MPLSQSKKRWRWAIVIGAIACHNDSLEPDGGAVTTVVIEPTRATVAVGATAKLTAEALDAAGKPVPGAKLVWATADPTIATISGDGSITGVAVGTVQVAASAQRKTAVAEVTVVPTPVFSVRLTPSSRDLMVGQTVQLSAQPMDAAGNPLANRPVAFTSSNSTVATVSNTGVVSAIAPGSAIITATSEGKSAVATITASAVPVASVVVTPNANPLVVGQTVQLKAEPRDGSGQVLAGRPVIWTTSAANIASVSSTGLVTAIAPGEATITASSEGKTGTASIAVSPKPVSSVIVSPSQSTVIVGRTTQLTAQVTDEQGNVLSGRPVAFSSSTPGVATVSSNGTVTGVAPGSVTITATSEGKTGTATVVVVPVPVATVEIGPPSANVVVGQTLQMTATAVAENGQVLVGRPVAWSINAPNVATISETGALTGKAPGSAVVTAAIEGAVGIATVTVRAVPVANVVVTPPTSNVVVGNSVQLNAAVTDAQGNALDRLVGWSSSDEAVAIVSSTGRVTGLKVGTATITASSEGKSGTATVTVTGAPVASVTVSPPTASLTLGQTTTLTAKTLDANGAELTGRTVTWSTSASSIATVSSTGVVTAAGVGTATITATSEGKQGTATVTVTAVPVSSVTVAPTTASLTVGGTQQITATPRDAQNNPLTGRAITWASGNTSVATVSQSGLITATGAGNTTVTATSEGKVGTVAVTVTPPPVGSVTVAPSAASVSVAFSTTLVATVRDVTGATVANAPVTWSSDKPLTASVSQSGVVTGLLPGTAIITAASGGKSGTATVTVGLAPVATVTVSPSQLNLRDRNNQRTGTLTATTRDALGNILSGRVVTWSSSKTSVATVDQSGVVTAQDPGSATITATSEGKSGTASVSVSN